MDGVSGTQLAANGIMSFAMLLIVNCVQGFRARRLRGIVAPIGKTTLAQKLSDDTCYIIDLDAYLSENHKEYDTYKHEPFQFVLQMYALASTYVKQITNNFRNKKLVICSSSYDLLVQLGVRKKRIWAFVPSPELVDKQTMSEERKRQLKRAEYHIAIHRVRKYYVFNEFHEMYAKVRQKLKLRQRPNS
jgi:hypothetical protein